MKTSPQFAGPQDSQELSGVRFSEPSLAVPSRSPRSAPLPLCAEVTCFAFDSLSYLQLFLLELQDLLCATGCSCHCCVVDVGPPR